MSVLLRRSSNKSNDPSPAIQPKRGAPLVSLEPRDPEAAQDKIERPTVFWLNRPWTWRFYSTPSFHHLFYGALTILVYKVYLTNAWYHNPIKLYLIHDGKQIFQCVDNIFTFASVVILGIVAIHLAIAFIPFVFTYYQMVHIREVNFPRALMCGVVDSMSIFVTNAHFGLHDFGSLLGCAFAGFSVSLFVLLGEHFSYYNALFVSQHARALPAIEIYGPTIFSIVTFFFAWLGPLARALGAHIEHTVETDPVRVLEIFACAGVRVLIDALGAANMLTYGVVEKMTWLLLILQLVSFAML